MKTANKQSVDFANKLERVINRLLADIVSVAGQPAKLDQVQRLEFVTNSLPSLMEALNASGYEELASELTDSSYKIINDIKKLHTITNVPIAFSRVDKAVLTALQDADLTAFAHIGEQAMYQVQQILMEHIIAGLPERDMIEAIRSELTDKFKRYAETYAQTSRGVYEQKVEDIIALNNREGGQELYWEYVGAEDNKNRDECVWALEKRFFTDEERADFEAEYGIRYNCRHIFIAVSKEAYETGEAPESDLSDEEIERRQAILESME